MKEKICFYAQPFPFIESYYDMIDEAVRHGLTAVEGFSHFELEEPDIQEARKIKAYADSKGVVFPCFSTCIDLTGENANENIEKVKKYADIAAILGSPYLHHTITPECFYPEKILPNKQKFFEKGILAVREIYDYAQKLGIKAIFEDQGYVFNGVEGFREFLEKVDRNVGVVADFGNIYQSVNTIEEFITAFSDKICHVHLKDISVTDSNIFGTGLTTITGQYVNEVPLGTGIIDFKKCFKMLKSIGYNGYYALEFGAKKDNDGSMETAINNLELWYKNAD